MLREIKVFFNNRDPDLEIFCQVFCMFLANFIGLLLWLVARLPCSMLIVLAPGIIVAIVFDEIKYGRITRISFKTAFIIAIFYVFVIMLNPYPLFVLIWVFFFVFILFSSAKNRYLISFAILPCSLVFNVNSAAAGALTAVDGVIEAFLSALITIVVVILIKELMAIYRMKKILFLLSDEIYKFFEKKCDHYNEESVCFFEVKIRILTSKAFKIIDRQRYCFSFNKRNSALSNSMLEHLVKIYRSILIFNHPSIETNTISIKPILEILSDIREFFRGNPSTGLKIGLPELVKENEFKKYSNYFAVKNLLIDLLEMKREINHII